MRCCLIAVRLIVLVALIRPAVADEKKPLAPDHPERAKKGLALFKSSVRATLTKHCLDCHGGKSVNGDFDLSSRELLMSSGFVTDAAQAEGDVTLGMFKAGGPDALSGVAIAPEFSEPCAGDLDGNQMVDLDDLNMVLTNFGQKSSEGDADGNKDGRITVGELQNYLSDMVPRQAMSMSRKQVPQLVGDAERVLVGR